MKTIGEFIRKILQFIFFTPAILFLILLGILAWILGIKEDDWLEK